VVTQRVVEVQIPGGTISEAQSPCNPDEVVTGGGYDVSEAAITSFGGRPIEEFASNNAWHIKIDSPPGGIGESFPIQVFAECLKLVPL
jgi:hypothetical protein